MTLPLADGTCREPPRAGRRPAQRPGGVLPAARPLVRASRVFRGYWLLVPKSSGEIWSRNSRNFSTSSSCSSGMAIPASSSTVSLP